MRRRIYLDSNAVIRLMESEEVQVEILFKRAEAGTVELFTSELTLAEALAGAYKFDDHALAEAYDELLQTNELIEVVPVTRDVLKQSAKLRAEFGGKTPDSIHLATAVLANCDIVVSSDKRLRLPPGLFQVTIEHISERDDLG